jgi:hypothetical protein
MSNPLDLKEFEHYLNFLSDDTGLIQISEPVKFDAAEFVIEQDDKGYARDISYMAEEFSLEFYEGFFENRNEPYQMLNGIIIDKLGHAIEYLFEYNKKFGFQSQIEYILKRNDVEFIIGELNFEGAETDERTYFNCKVVQATTRALARRREDTEIDMFGTEDLDGNAIEPLQTESILLKAKPVTQITKWDSVSDYITQIFLINAETLIFPFNPARSLVQFGVEDSFTPFDSSDFRYVKAKSSLSDLKLNVKNLNVGLLFDTTFGITSSSNPLGGQFDFYLNVRTGDDFNAPVSNQKILISSIIIVFMSIFFRFCI